MGACAFVLFACGLATADAETRGESNRIRVDVRLSAGSGRVEGRVHAFFVNPGAQPLERVYLWLLPNRLGEPPAALDDVNHYWIYPRAFNPGSMSVTRVRAGAPGHEQVIAAADVRDQPHAVAGPGTLVSVELAEPIAPGQRLGLVVEFRARIPERYGSLGCIDGQCTLMGGFYPMPAGLDAAGWDLEGPPMRADMEVSVALDKPASVVLFDRVFGQVTETAAGKAGARVTRVQASFRDAPYAPLFVAPRLYESRRVFARQGQAGMTLRYLAAEPPPPTDIAHEQILPYTQENHARYALESAESALALLAGIDAQGVLAGGREVLMVEAPLRFQLADSHPGVIAVSDRFYRIWPAKRFRKFHQRQLVRAFFNQLMGRLIEQRAAERARDRDSAADLLASYLTDLYDIREYRKSEFMGDILQPVAFIPVVDQLLYAPQTMFAGAYFGSVLDDEPLRDHPGRFMHQRPRGRLLYEKLRDLLTPEAMRAAMRAMIVDGARFRDAAERAYGAPMDWFFRQWEGPYPATNYRLLGVSSTRLDSGQGGGGYEHEIRVERRTAAGDTPPVEPVTVLVVLASGARRVLRWDGRGQVGVLTLRSSETVDHVVVDPSHRLVERWLPGDDQHPLFDNRDEHRVRFVYNSFGVLLNITDLSALLAVDFSLGRVHDVRQGSRFALFTSESTLIGGSARYSRHFGPAITPDRLRSSATVRFAAQRLKAGFFGEGEPAASRVTLGLSLGSSDRLFIFEPRFARDLAVGGSLGLTRFDAADSRAAEYALSGSLAVGYSRLYTIGGGHTLGLELDLAAVFGDISARSQLTNASGATGLRGYAPGALFGRSKALVRAEYRHVFTHQMNWNLGHYNFLRGIGGALFVDAGALSSCERHDLLAPDRMYASVGYGLRFFYDSFGTLPQFMRLDVAVPLVRRDRDCLGSALGGGPPVMVYLGFLPPF